MSPDYLPFFFVGMAVIPVALAARIFLLITDSTCYGLLALSQVLVCLAGFVTGNTVSASISGAAAGYLAWKWWTGDGDDNTKRRLRKWARRFRGVRRTASAGA